MPRVLQRVPFTTDLLSAVQEFYCGDESWEQEVAAWIKGTPPGVLEDMARGCEVWLYITEEDGLVGFGSLAPSRWKWPTLDDPRVPINIIPMLGVQRQFWGQPNDPGVKTFAARILDDLIYEARRHRERQPLLGLFVHSRNTRARRAYKRAGFEDFLLTYTDPDTGTVYRSMVLKLAP